MAQFVVVVITLFGIYRQVKLQASASAIQQMDAITKEWRSEASTRQTVEILQAVHDGVPFPNVPYGPASTIVDFWEGIAYLVRKGHIDFRLFSDNLGPSMLWWWTALKPWVLRIRIEAGLPHGLEDFEWLAGRVATELHRQGDPTEYDEGHVRRTFESRLENDRDRIRIAEQLRAAPADAPPKSRGRSGSTTRRISPKVR
jgi:hypothetical protein